MTIIAEDVGTQTEEKENTFNFITTVSFTFTEIRKTIWNEIREIENFFIKKYKEIKNGSFRTHYKSSRV